MQKAEEGNLPLSQLILFLYFSLHSQKQAAEVSTICCMVLSSETLPPKPKQQTNKKHTKKKRPKEINGMKGCE